MKISTPRLGLALMTAAAVGLAVANIATESHSAETAQAAVPRLAIDATAECDAGNAVFRIRNTGEAWPKASTFAIYRLTEQGGDVISKRRMRLQAGQQASFWIKANRNTTGRLGLSVDPSWYDRRKVLDARLDCR